MTRGRVRRVRWKGAVPLGVFFVLAAVAWWLLLDPVVRWSVEEAGTEVVGARVDVAEADVRLTEGVVYLRALAVTNPDRPMTNLFEADEIVVNLRVAPLLEKKVVIDTVAVRGLRFNTPRATSGAVSNPGPTSGLAWRNARGWASRIRLPDFSLEGLRQVVNVEGLRPDSLVTLRQVRALPGIADSLRVAQVRQLEQLDPTPTIDSARALTRRLENTSLPALGLSGARDAAGSARSLIQALTTLDDRLAALHQSARSGVTDLQSRLAGLEDRRREDYAYARSLMKVPSLDAPDLAPALFGGIALERMTPVLAWIELAERWMPPGVERRLREGPGRVRASGTDVVFPRRQQLPTFLLEFAEASFELGGTGAAAGRYAALVTGVTSAPALYGAPATFKVERAGGQAGPRRVRAGGIINHVGLPVRDSVAVVVQGLTLPGLSLGPLGARVEPGPGVTDVLVQRVGDSVSARWFWRAEDVRWTRLHADSTAPAAGGAGGRLESLLWRAVSAVRNVEVTAALDGPLSRPRLRVQSNVAGAVATALRNELGQEIRRLEQEARARVDSLVQPRIAEARRAVTQVEADVLRRVERQRTALAEAKEALEQRLRALVRIPGVGG